jgi:hypothetical protein
MTTKITKRRTTRCYALPERTQHHSLNYSAKTIKVSDPSSHFQEKQKIEDHAT